MTKCQIKQIFVLPGLWLSKYIVVVVVIVGVGVVVVVVVVHCYQNEGFITAGAWCTLNILCFAYDLQKSKRSKTEISTGQYNTNLLTPFFIIAMMETTGSVYGVAMPALLIYVPPGKDALTPTSFLSHFVKRCCSKNMLYQLTTTLDNMTVSHTAQ